jgi:hypothetical protein
MRELTVAEYMELVQGEGLLIKSMAGQIMSTDGVGSNVQDEADEPEDDEEEADDDDPAEDEDDEEETEDGPTEFTLTICTDDVDRLSDILDPMGAVTDNFAANPLFLYEHGSGSNGMLTNPDSVLGQVKGVTLSTKSLLAHVKYVPRTGNVLASKILDMERKGLIPGNSIGWRPLAGITLHENGNRHIAKWELIDVSKVLMPVNGKAVTKKYA